MQPFYGKVMELNPCKTIIEVREARVDCSYQRGYRDLFFNEGQCLFRPICPIRSISGQINNHLIFPVKPWMTLRFLSTCMVKSWNRRIVMQTASCNLRICVIKQTLINNSIQSEFLCVTLPNPSISKTREIYTYVSITLYYGKIILDESIRVLINVTLTMFLKTASGSKLALRIMKL